MAEYVALIVVVPLSFCEVHKKSMWVCVQWCQ